MYGLKEVYQVREMSNLVFSLKAVTWVLLFICLLLYSFLLKLFALQNTLGKGWFLSLLVCVFFFFLNTESLWQLSAAATGARPYQP